MSRETRTLFGHKSFGRYVLLGLGGLAVDVGVFAVLIELEVLPVIATVISSFFGIVTNYFLNARFNFGQVPSVSRGSRFIVVGIAGLVLSALILQGMLWLGSGVWLAKGVSLGVVVVAQYVANRFWTFR